MSGSDLRNDDAQSAQGRCLSTTHPCMALLAEIGPKASSEEVATARQSIDDEIEAASLAICDMRSRRNDLSPIAVLPPEMLANVFEFSALIEPPEGGRSGTLGWIGVTHVCRAWRQVAFQHPRLWRNIVFTLGPTWTNNYFTRSKSTPICINTPLGHSRRYWDVMRSHLWHTAALELDGNKASLDTVVQSLTSPAPKLEVLQLETDFNDLHDFMFPTRLFLPSNFLGNDAPSLRHITLQDISFSWASLAFRTLSSLDVTVAQGQGVNSGRNLAPHIYDAQSLSTLLDILQGMPNLEKLALDGCIPDHLPSDLATKTVELPLLKSLTLAGPVENCEGLWRFLRISPLVKLHLRCTLELNPIKGLNRILALINTYLCAPERDDIPILTFHLSSHFILSSTLTAMAWRYCKPKTSPSGGSDVIFELSSSPNLIPDDICQKVRWAFPLERVQALRLEPPQDTLRWTKRDWVKVFGRSKALEHVCVVRSAAYGFCEALTDIGDLPYPGRQGVNQITLPYDAVFLPALRFVSLVDVDFQMACDTTPFYKALPEWLKGRSQLGLPFAHLDIRDSTIEKEWVENLEGRVRTVTWDHSRGDLASEEDNEDEDGDMDSWDEEHDLDGP